MATKTRKREREKENCIISDNREMDGSKALNLSINQEMLDDMGISILQEDNILLTKEPTPTPPNTEAKISSSQQSNRILCEKDQNISQSSGTSDILCPDSDFFVYKRRRIEQVGGEDKFNRMLDEVILHIFKYLPKYMLARGAQVCRRWKRLAFDESLWRRLDLGGKALKPGVVGRVLLRGTNTLRLAKSDVSVPVFSPQLHHLKPEDTGLIRSRLTHLDMSLATIDPSGICEVLQVCYDLQKLSLEHCTLNEEACRYIANNHNLDTLNLAMCYKLDEKCLVPILENCRRLQSLNLAWTSLSETTLNIICNKFPSSLDRLNLSGCRNSLLDCHIQQIGQTANGLLELDVSDCTRLTSLSIQHVLKYFKNVEYLAFARCYHIQPEFYITLKQLSKLLYLNVYGVILDSALSSLQNALPNITLNKYFYSSVARPTVGVRRTSIWGRRVRD